jgi:hypothetical protein
MLRIRIQSGRYNFAGYTVQNIGNYDIYDDDEREKTMKTGTAVYKVKKTSVFPTCSKLTEGVGSGSGSGSASKWKVGSGSASQISINLCQSKTQHIVVMPARLPAFHILDLSEIVSSSKNTASFKKDENLL